MNSQLSSNQVIENGTRLSKSVLWQLQDKAYTQFGLQSWTQMGVPFQITSSPFIAKQYALIALEHLRSLGKFDEPQYFLEIGGGNGKFAYHFLTELLPRLQSIGIPSSAICYVLTDLAEKNVTFWKRHPLLGAFIEKGVLDVAVYDPLSSNSIHLEFKNCPLAPSTNPLFVIANYFFDSISQDLFRVKKGELFEGRITLRSKDETHLSLDNPEIFDQLREEYTYHPLVKNHYYYPDFPQLNDVLNWYRDHIEEANFLLPIGGFRAIHNLLSLSKSSLVILTGDKGVCRKHQFTRQSQPKLNLQGTISFPVNFHAIAQYFLKPGGEALLPSYPLSNFAVCLFSTFALAPALKLSYQDQIDAFGPQESFDHLRLFEKECPNPSLKHLLLHVQLANWDASLFFAFFDTFQKLFKTAEKEEIDLFFEATGQIRSRFYPMHREEALLLYKLGLFLQKLGKEKEAESCFQQAISFNSLPKIDTKPEEGDQHSLKEFVDQTVPSGDVLQIGIGRRSVGETVRCHKPKSHVLIPLSYKDSSWQEALDQVHTFDTILFIAPYHHFETAEGDGSFSLVNEGKKKMQEIESKFSFLKEIAYSDEDIEMFFTLLERETLVDPIHFLRFFSDLEQKRNITPGQMVTIQNRLKQENLITEETLKTFFAEERNPQSSDLSAENENDLFFSVLRRCLKSHMKKGSIFKAYLYNVTSKLDDNKFLNEIVMDPFLEFKEEIHPLFDTREVSWVTITKFGT